MLTKSEFAQGTIEYLVIIAVVVVLSLVVVALVITISESPANRILESSSKLGGVVVGGISIIESVVDLDGDSLVRLGNNYGDFIYLKKITLCDGFENDYGEIGEQLIGGDSKVFHLVSQACEVGEKDKVCAIEIEYITRDGLSKKDSKIITVSCVFVATSSQ